MNTKTTLKEIKKEQQILIEKYGECEANAILEEEIEEIVEEYMDDGIVHEIIIKNIMNSIGSDRTIEEIILKTIQ